MCGLVVLQPHHGVAAAGLERLHPVLALLAHAQGHAGRSQAAIGRVEIRGPQAQIGVLAGVEAGEFGSNGLQCAFRNLEFQFNFLHA